MHGKWGKNKGDWSEDKAMQSPMHAPILKKVNTVRDEETEKADRLCYRTDKPSTAYKKIRKVVLVLVWSYLEWFGEKS